MKQPVEQLSPFDINNPSAGLLSGYSTRSQLAQGLRCSERSIARYENEPDGLLSVLIAGRELYRIESVKEWLAKKEHRPNQRRAGRGARDDGRRSDRIRRGRGNDSGDGVADG